MLPDVRQNGPTDQHDLPQGPKVGVLALAEDQRRQVGLPDPPGAHQRAELLIPSILKTEILCLPVTHPANKNPDRVGDGPAQAVPVLVADHHLLVRWVEDLQDHKEAIAREPGAHTKLKWRFSGTKSCLN